MCSVDPREPKAARFAPQVHVIRLDAEEWKGLYADKGLPGGVVQVKVTSGTENIVEPGLGDACPHVGVGKLGIGGRGASHERGGDQEFAHDYPRWSFRRV